MLASSLFPQTNVQIKAEEPFLLKKNCMFECKKFLYKIRYLLS